MLDVLLGLFRLFQGYFFFFNLLMQGVDYSDDGFISNPNNYYSISL